MRQIDEAFAARLAANGTSLCACWKFTRHDGAVFGATDHDLPIMFDDVIFEPANGLSGVAFDSSAGLAPGRAAATGAMSVNFMADADLDAGLWDGARVDVWRVDWLSPMDRVHIWSGRLSELSRQGEGYRTEVVSLKADLERPIGRVYSRTCDADVGDERCGVNFDDPAFAGLGAVAGVLGPKRFSASGLADFEEGWFTGGVVAWIDGANGGSLARVIRHAGEEIELATTKFEISEGDTFLVTAGCAKDFAMCGIKFDNRENFRGFPHMPGPDVVLVGPASDRPNDGGRRN